MQEKKSTSRSNRLGKSLSRRKLLSGVLTLGAFSLLGKVSQVFGQSKPSSPILDPANDTSTELGPPGTALGQRTKHEKISRVLRPHSPMTSGTPHEDLMGTITPADLHFERHHAGVPTVDPEKYALLIHGMVERPMVFTLEDLKRFPSVTSIHFLECSGNFNRNAKEDTKPSRIAPLMSNTEWTGVPLLSLLQEVGVHPEAKWLIAEGQDGAKMNRSIPLEKAWDDSMIAYGQNGEPLRPEQGYPARLLNPGWEGNTSVKWLRRIEVTDKPSMTREETSKYTESIQDGKVRQFSYVVQARSLITSPAYPEVLAPGIHTITGLAWSGRGKIAKVEISTDDRKTWQEATLQEPVRSKAFTRFQFAWDWQGEATSIWSRAIDETGYVQPTMSEFWESREGHTGYHTNPTTGWEIKKDGQVIYHVQKWEV